MIKSPKHRHFSQYQRNGLLVGAIITIKPADLNDNSAKHELHQLIAQQGHVIIQISGIIYNHSRTIQANCQGMVRLLLSLGTAPC